MPKVTRPPRPTLSDRVPFRVPDPSSLFSFRPAPSKIRKVSIYTPFEERVGGKRRKKRRQSSKIPLGLPYLSAQRLDDRIVPGGHHYASSLGNLTHAGPRHLDFETKYTASQPELGSPFLSHLLPEEGIVLQATSALPTSLRSTTRNRSSSQVANFHRRRRILVPVHQDPLTICFTPPFLPFPLLHTHSLRTSTQRSVSFSVTATA
ncbi:hypothetical protein CGCF413_v003202 [Colletotrichum fructicola]|nr:hypothetical protein CGCF413_v003202 [Colletotrichum fructicola]